MQLVKAIYTMYKLVKSVRSAGSILARSRRLGREEGTSGEGQAPPAASWHWGDGGGSADGASQYKNMERIL